MQLVEYGTIVCIMICSWWSMAVRRATGLAKYMLFGVFIILLDRLHQKYGRSRTSSSSCNDILVRD